MGYVKCRHQWRKPSGSAYGRCVKCNAVDLPPCKDGHWHQWAEQLDGKLRCIHCELPKP